jgi:heme-degrading monooxygenase HmoA
MQIKVHPSEAQNAEGIWKNEYTPVMISQKGCLSAKLLRPRNLGEFISYSEWETEADLERFTSSTAHQRVVGRIRGLKAASAGIKLCDLVK